MRAYRICREPGCPESTPTAWCLAHAREHERRRGSRQARGYGADHDRLRRAYEQRLAAGETFTCAKCHKVVTAAHAWQLGHDDLRRSYTGPEHNRCNLSEAGRKAHRFGV